jgi:tRNA pseudouridine55 synthase
VSCSKGTYIRTLAQDIGEELGCGAHLSMLRRTSVSPFDCSKIYTVEELEQIAESEELESVLLSIDSALINFPVMHLSEADVELIRNGIKVQRNDTPKNEMIRLYSNNNQFIGIGKYFETESGEKLLAPKRMMNTQTPLMKSDKKLGRKRTEF